MDVIKEFRTIQAVFVVGMKQRFRYPTWFLHIFLGPFVLTTTTILTYKSMISPSSIQNFSQLSGGITDVAGFIILGSGIAEFWLFMLWGTGYFIENQRGAGTLEVLFLTPTNKVVLLLGVALQDFAFSSLTIGMMVTLCGLAFGMNLYVVDPVGLSLCFILTVIALYAVGIFFASFFVLTRSTNLLANFLQAPIVYFSGMNFPVNAIPKMFLFFSALIPITFGIDAFRKMSLAGASMTMVWHDILGLTLHTIIFSILGIWGLKFAENQALKKGDMSFY
jgi:ABC-2 type transport system permease protein